MKKNWFYNYDLLEYIGWVSINWNVLSNSFFIIFFLFFHTSAHLFNPPHYQFYQLYFYIRRLFYHLLDWLDWRYLISFLHIIIMNVIFLVSYLHKQYVPPHINFFFFLLISKITKHPALTTTCSNCQLEKDDEKNTNYWWFLE